MTDFALYLGSQKCGTAPIILNGIKCSWRRLYYSLIIVMNLLYGKFLKGGDVQAVEKGRKIARTKGMIWQVLE